MQSSLEALIFGVALYHLMPFNESDLTYLFFVCMGLWIYWLFQTCFCRVTSLSLQIGNVFGAEYLLKLYVAGAVVGSIFYLVHHAYLANTSKV